MKEVLLSPVYLVDRRSIALCNIIIIIMDVDTVLLVGLYNPGEHSGIYQLR